MITKKILLGLIILSIYTSTTFGQVGINTTSPASTLDVVAGETNSPEGIIAPRLTLQELISKTPVYGTKQTGAILYINNISGNTSARTRNITSIGYYYYDGINWQPFSKTSSSVSDYWSINGNSNLSALRGENYLGTSNASDLVLKTNNVEQMTISSAGNIGIGTNSPTNKLHIKSSSNPVKIEGLSANTTSGAKPIVVGSDGILKTGEFPNTGTGTTISDYWSINGNSNLSTTRGTNYLGTSNATDLVFKTNKVEQMTISSAGNIGIGTNSPTNKLHIKSSSNPVKIEGLTTNTASGVKPIVVGSDGVLKKGEFPTIDLVPDDVGTVIAIGGKLLVAQEITVLMTADFPFEISSMTPTPIGNLTNVVIDNHNTFKSDSKTNSFTVDADGTYQITMNVQLKDASDIPVIGVWCDNCASIVAENPIGRWVARVNDRAVSTLQTYTLITAIEMYKGNTYSFRVAGASTGTIPWSSSGYTGSGPISFYSLKRLR